MWEANSNRPKTQAGDEGKVTNMSDVQTKKQTIFIIATGGTLSYQKLHVSASMSAIVMESALYLCNQN